jgi:hypothetical protein
MSTSDGAAVQAEEQRKKMMRAYNDALLVQSACNLSGVVFSFAQHMETLCAESHRLNEGTDWRNKHPIVRMFVAQLLHLSNNDAVDSDIYVDSLDACIAGADEKTVEMCGFHKAKPAALLGEVQEAGPVFRVDEHYNGFELVHIASDHTHWLSDGVDVLYDEFDHAIAPGEAFCKAWALQFNSNVDETLEAYFPDLVS